MMQLVKDMAFLVNHLMDERGAGSRHVEPQEDPRWFMEQWEQFRALVNTREPKPASPSAVWRRSPFGRLDSRWIG